MSNAVRQQLGLQSEDLRKADKHEDLPTHDYHIGQDVMFQDVTSKWWYPATITSLCQEPRSYKITTRVGCQLQEDTSPFETLLTTKQEGRSKLNTMEQSSDMWILKQSDHKKSDSMNNQVQSNTEL